MLRVLLHVVKNVVGAVLLMRPFKAWLIAQAYKHNVTDADTTR